MPEQSRLLDNSQSLPDSSARAQGKVYLVGAGPGDSSLLTLRGAELLKRCQVLVIDRLIPSDLLEMVSRDCRIIDAGKSGSRHTLTQSQINSVLVRWARLGKEVVRLKGGDPYVFGRGGEEAVWLKEHNVPFEVVPGVSAAVAAASCAGIPLTHRDMSSQLVILTGHEKLDKDKSSHDWAALAKMGTLSIVMGAANLAQICQKLMANGKDPQTPAAMIEKGATPAQRVVIGTISELPTLAAQAGLSPPSLVVVGQVVKLRQTLNWFEERPLWGRKVMVTRTRAQAGRLSSLLKDLGAQVIERPVIRIEPIAPNPALEIVLDNLINFNWLILTSPNGASFFLNSLFARGFDARSLSGLKIAVIGPATGEALAPYGLKPDLTPLTYMAEGLLESFKEVKPGRLILARAEGARDVLPVGLKNFGFEVTELNLYRTLPALNFGDPLTFKELKKNPPHLTTLTSASSAKALASVIGQADRFLFPVCSIGPITSLAAQEFGFTVAAQSQQASILSMVSAMTEYFKRVEYSYEPWI